METAALTALISLAAKYGPSAVTGFIALFKKGDPTIEEVEAEFAQLKTYENFGIPEKAPTAPTA